jgi:hypothetical protein
MLGTREIPVLLEAAVEVAAVGGGGAVADMGSRRLRLLFFFFCQWNCGRGDDCVILRRLHQLIIRTWTRPAASLDPSPGCLPCLFR